MGFYVEYIYVNYIDQRRLKRSTNITTLEIITQPPNTCCAVGIK